jgi:hypothetical protein
MSKRFAAVAAMMFVLAPGLALSDPWDKQINNPNRFKVLADFAGAAVLDRETGLVWERSPETTQFLWLQAQAHCNLKSVDNRKGWRLPAVQELASLVDSTIPSPGPTLPAGHPFLNIQVNSDPSLPPGTSASAYWTANSWSGDPTLAAWDVSFNTGVVANTAKSSFHWVWCVRGGAGVDIQ